MMVTLRVLLNFIVAGALAGVLISTVTAPSYLTWNNTPGSGTALCNCADLTRQTASQLISAQMTGCGAGAAVGLIAGIAFRVMRKKKVDPSPTTPAA